MANLDCKRHTMILPALLDFYLSFHRCLISIRLSSVKILFDCDITVHFFQHNSTILLVNLLPPHKSIQKDLYPNKRMCHFHYGTVGKEYTCLKKMQYIKRSSIVYW